MRLPRFSRPRVLHGSPHVGTAIPPAHPIYWLHACTINLGATDDEPGHPRLKHCLVEVRDGRGRLLRRLSIGREGLGAEAYAHVASRRCGEQATSMSALELGRFERALRGCAEAGYLWGERDCCSCIERAFARGLGLDAPDLIRTAAADLAAVPDPWGPRA